MLAGQKSLGAVHLHYEAVAHAHSRADVLLKELLTLQEGSKKRHFAYRACHDTVLLRSDGP